MMHSMKQFWKKQFLMRIFVWIVVGVIALILFARLFMRVYPEFGGRPNAADRADYLKRAGAYEDGERFFYPEEWKQPGIPVNQIIPYVVEPLNFKGYNCQKIIYIR